MDVVWKEGGEEEEGVTLWQMIAFSQFKDGVQMLSVRFVRLAADWIEETASGAFLAVGETEGECSCRLPHSPIHLSGWPPPSLPSLQPLRPPAASWQGSPACCRGRGPAWWAAAGPARSWWSATCSGCTPGSGWLSAGSGTTGRWCPGD